MENGLDAFSKQLLEASKDFELGEKTKNFLKKSGNKLKNKTKAVARSRVKEYSGNYLRSIKRGKLYEYEGALTIRTYASPIIAPHAHLIEHGHIIKNKAREEVGYKDGYDVFSTAADEYEKEFESEVQEHVQNILGEYGVE